MGIASSTMVISHVHKEANEQAVLVAKKGVDMDSISIREGK